MTAALQRGAIMWVDLDPVHGREQAGQRPALVVASDSYLASVPDLVIVVPLTTVDRQWPHHVRIEGTHTGLRKVSFAMTEQPRTIDRGRITRRAGMAGRRTMAAVDQWLRDFIELH